MFASIFGIVQLLLKLLGLWELFLDSLDKADLAAIETRRQAREKALDAATNAKTPEDAFAAQEDIDKSSPP